jgi:subtilisin family serine protease
MFERSKPRLRIFLGWLIALELCFTLIGSARAEKPNIPDPPSDQVAVKLKANVSINTILARYNASLLGTLTETNLYFLQLPAGQTANAVLPALNADPDLYYAEPNYYSESLPSGGHIMFGAHMSPLAEHIMFGAHGDVTPVPPDGSTQWAWTKIGLADAQKISRGQGIIVAVLDTGMAPDHPLLNSSIIAGYDFVGMTNSIYDTGNGLDDTGNGQIDEYVGHGTHVSGIIVTEAPGVQIMPIRVLNSDGVGTYWEVAAGIKYAVDHGAKIINMSLSAPRLTPSLSDALDYAASHGVIVVAAAGTGTGPNYPAAYSINRGDRVGERLGDTSGFGRTGSGCGCVRPGKDIYSATLWLWTWQWYIHVCAGRLWRGCAFDVALLGLERGTGGSADFEQNRSDHRPFNGTRQLEQGLEQWAGSELLAR